MFALCILLFLPLGNLQSKKAGVKWRLCVTAQNTDFNVQRSTGKLCSILQVFRMNLEKLSKPELLTLFSILEGELEARDLVIEALKVRCEHRDKRQN